MPIYIINYYFDGQGEVEIEAKSPEDAKKKFFEGDYSNENEWGENYNINTINKK